MPFAHFIAHTCTGSADLLAPKVARRLWSGLNRSYPLALAVILMPNHLHLVGLIAAIAEALARFRYAMSNLVLELDVAWEPIEPPEILRDGLQLRRNLRYVWLNPCRKGLASDPLEWLWSTYRDWLGAAARPWLDASRLSEALGDGRPDFEARFHRYCTTDRSVSRTGTPLPILAPPSTIPVQGLREIALASAAATRQPVDALKRKGIARSTFLELAVRQGWKDANVLASPCNITPRAVRKRRLPVGDQTIHSASLCLGDPRLRIGTPGKFPGSS